MRAGSGSPTALAFTNGTLVARIDVSGNLRATGNGQSTYIVNVNTPIYSRQISGALYGIGSNAGVILGDDFGSYLLEIPFTFGQPFMLSVQGNVVATVQLNDAGSAWLLLTGVGLVAARCRRRSTT